MNEFCLFRAFYRRHFLHDFHTWGVTFKGKALATKCIFQNYSQLLDICTRLVLKTVEEFILPSVYKHLWSSGETMELEPIIKHMISKVDETSWSIAPWVQHRLQGSYSRVRENGLAVCYMLLFFQGVQDHPPSFKIHKSEPWARQGRASDCVWEVNRCDSVWRDVSERAGECVSVIFVSQKLFFSVFGIRKFVNHRSNTAYSRKSGLGECCVSLWILFWRRIVHLNDLNAATFSQCLPGTWAHLMMKSCNYGCRQLVTRLFLTPLFVTRVTLLFMTWVLKE